MGKNDNDQMEHQTLDYNQRVYHFKLMGEMTRCYTTHLMNTRKFITSEVGTWNDQLKQHPLERGQRIHHLKLVVEMTRCNTTHLITKNSLLQKECWKQQIHWIHIIWLLDFTSTCEHRLLKKYKNKVCHFF